MGQNFLNNQNVLSQIVNSGNISCKDIILEIGPGTGNLTEKILEKNPKHLVVIEKDEDLSLSLKKNLEKELKL